MAFNNAGIASLPKKRNPVRPPLGAPHPIGAGGAGTVTAPNGSNAGSIESTLIGNLNAPITDLTAAQKQGIGVRAGQQFDAAGRRAVANAAAASGGDTASGFYNQNATNAILGAEGRRAGLMADIDVDSVRRVQDLQGRRDSQLANLLGMLTGRDQSNLDRSSRERMFETGRKDDMQNWLRQMGMGLLNNGGIDPESEDFDRILEQIFGGM